MFIIPELSFKINIGSSGKEERLVDFECFCKFCKSHHSDTVKSVFFKQYIVKEIRV